MPLLHHTPTRLRSLPNYAFCSTLIPQQVLMRWVIRVLLVIVLFSGTLGAQGFGRIKRHVQLRRKLPPIAQLTGSFDVKAVARDKANDQIAQKLADLLETEILQYNNQLLPDKVKPDNTISCTVISFSLPPARIVNKTTGYDKAGKPITGQFSEVHGSIVVSYQAKTRAGRILDSDNVVEKFNGEYDAAGNKTGNSVTEALKKPWHAIRKPDQKEPPKDFQEVLQELIGQAAYDIAAHLVKTDEGVDVMLARGKLDDYNKLAEAGLWPRMLEPLETMTPLPKAEDDSYRLYNIAVVYEAMAYKAEDAKSAKKFLDQAAINYGKAIDANPGEKYFLQPQNRIETALAHYKKLETQASAPARTDTA